MRVQARKNLLEILFPTRFLKNSHHIKWNVKILNFDENHDFTTTKNLYYCTKKVVAKIGHFSNTIHIVATLTLIH